MTQDWTPPDPGYRIDGPLPPGFDVGALLGQLYAGQRLTRGTSIPVGAARVTVTAEFLDVPAPGSATPVGQLTTPPGMTDPMQLALWLKGQKASGQIQPGTVVQLQVADGQSQVVTLGGTSVGGRSGADLRAALLASFGVGGVAGGQMTGSPANLMFSGAAHGDITDVIGRLMATMNAATIQHAGGLGRLLGTPAGGGDSIRAHDPAFSEAGLLTEATAALWALVVARAENRPDAVRRHLAGPMYEREARQMQIDGMQARRRIVEGLEVRSATIDECGASSLGDHATIRFRLWGADRDVDSNGKRMAGDKKPTEWHELWTLARPSGSTTPPPGSPAGPCTRCGFAGADPSADFCPGCGHPQPAAPGRWLVVAVVRLDQRRQ